MAGVRCCLTHPCISFQRWRQCGLNPKPVSGHGEWGTKRERSICGYWKGLPVLDIQSFLIRFASPALLTVGLTSCMGRALFLLGATQLGSRLIRWIKASLLVRTPAKWQRASE